MARKKKGKKGKLGEFALTRRMHLFLDTARDRGMSGKSMTLKDIAEACGLDPTRPSKWMRVPEFRASLSLLIRDIHAPLIEASIAALLQQAVRGNLAAFDKVMTWLDRLGRITTRDPQAGTPSSNTQPSADSPERVELINGMKVRTKTSNGTTVRIYGIPEPTSRATLPPPLERPGKATTTNQPAMDGDNS